MESKKLVIDITAFPELHDVDQDYLKSLCYRVMVHAMVSPDKTVGFGRFDFNTPAPAPVKEEAPPAPEDQIPSAAQILNSNAAMFDSNKLAQETLAENNQKQE